MPPKSELRFSAPVECSLQIGIELAVPEGLPTVRQL